MMRNQKRNLLGVFFALAPQTSCSSAALKDFSTFLFWFAVTLTAIVVAGAATVMWADVDGNRPGGAVVAAVALVVVLVLLA